MIVKGLSSRGLDKEQPKLSVQKVPKRKESEKILRPQLLKNVSFKQSKIKSIKEEKSNHGDDNFTTDSESLTESTCNKKFQVDKASTSSAEGFSQDSRNESEDKDEKSSMAEKLMETVLNRQSMRQVRMDSF